MASRLRRRSVVLPTIAVLVVGGGAVAFASTGGSSVGYRTALVTTSDVQDLLTLQGTVAAVNQQKVRFRTSGTVSSVKVAAGAKVKAGQVLATLDKSALQDAVTSAVATYTKAQATLETAQSATTSSSTTTTSTKAPTSSPTTPASTVDTAALTRTEKAADQALAAATMATQSAVRACSTSAGPAPTAAASETPSPEPSPSASPLQPVPSADPSCASALQAALAAQQRSAAAQQAVAAVIRGTTGGPSTHTGRLTTASAASESVVAAVPTSGPSTSNGGGGGQSAQVKAAQITVDTAAVTAASIALATARANLASASVVSPIDGTVASLPWTAGSSTSNSDAAVVVGSGSVDVTVDVVSTKIRSVKVGQKATALADGLATTTPAKVSAIGLLPTASSSTSSASSSTTTYPVTVHVPAGAGFVDGSEATISIVMSTVKNAITVPNSALHDTRVIVLTKGKPVTTRVVVGAKGPLVSQVTSGLKAGQVVVIADLSEALPTSSTSNRNRTGFGGFGGNGTFGGPPTGGFGGPPPGAGTFTRGG